MKVKALTEEVKGRPTKTKKGECRAIFTKEGLPLYTPFYYSPKEIEYFFVDSSLSDEKVQEEMKEAEEINHEVAQCEPIDRILMLSNPQLVSYYVAAYKPPIMFPRRLEQYAKEALIVKALGSLKRIKINRPPLKEIRQTDNYAKYMKNLVENKLRSSEDEDVKMNTRCATILQNHLPPKEQDPWSFTLPCSIGKLTFNALADLGASISDASFNVQKYGNLPREDLHLSRREMTPPSGFLTLTPILNPKANELPPMTTSTFTVKSPKNMPLTYRASTLANPDPMISPAFVEANYEVLESLLREHRRRIRNEDLQLNWKWIQRFARARENTLVSHGVSSV
ncbi:hypothetical protein Tco_1066828 [Tanacetum coccineum]|uniref:Uncharacterized protein n=1 Tax=Tanacetum coccineum TaxID=301880 RepID=A0ABQ5HB58_9ASTR